PGIRTVYRGGKDRAVTGHHDEIDRKRGKRANDFARETLAVEARREVLPNHRDDRKPGLAGDLFGATVAVDEHHRYRQGGPRRGAAGAGGARAGPPGPPAP